MAGEGPTPVTILLEETQSCTNWDDVICPICLHFPHNCVLLQCSSYEKGCRPFVCGTDHLHSNCLDRYKEANGMPAGTKSWSSSEGKSACPLCRGEVTGWTVVEKARKHLDVKIRFCEEEKCPFTGTYSELQKHAKTEHPHTCPSKIDPARRRDWENFQRSSELIDVLTHIHSEVPNGMILGDYVVEYEEGNTEEDAEDVVNEDEEKWWRSCIFYQIFGSFTACRSRRRSRESRRENRRSNSDEGSMSSGEHADNNADDGDGEFTGSRELSRGRSGQRR